MKRFLSTGMLTLFVVGCTGTVTLVDQVKTYNDTVHKQYFTLSERMIVGLFDRTFDSAESPGFRSILQEQVDMLRNMTEFWRTLPVTGTLVAKRDAVAVLVRELFDWKSAINDHKHPTKPEGVASILQLEGMYLLSYGDFLKVLFPDGDVAPSFTAEDYMRPLQGYFQK